VKLGINPTDDTVFLIDWYGRPDFQFHTYTHFGHPDPDTGIDGGFYTGSLTRAWGGSSGPTWFYDLSANPDYWDDSYDVDDADIDGDGVTDYRMPPIWEYGNTSGYRPFTDLSGDLAKVLRYVALDLLFTPSPLYDPAVTVPGPDGGKQVDLDIFEGDPASNGEADVHPDSIQAQVQGLEPYYHLGVTVHDQPLAGDPLTAWSAATSSPTPSSCLSQYALPEAVLYCFFHDNRASYFPPSGQDAVIPAAGFTVPANPFNWSGETDDDWSTGLPSFIYEIDYPALRAGLYAYTEITSHEAGHYVGLSHPHDGYDSTTGTDIEPKGPTTFAWTGDESSTLMSYLWGEESYGVFDRDNLARWQVARLLDLADTDAGVLLSAPHSPTVDQHLAAADAAFKTSLADLQKADFVAAAAAAVTGYRAVQRADASASVTSALIRLDRARPLSESSAGNGDRPGTIDTPTRRPLSSAALAPLPLP
jgi:hypothetical protein